MKSPVSFPISVSAAQNRVTLSGFTTEKRSRCPNSGYESRIDLPPKKWKEKDNGNRKKKLRRAAVGVGVSLLNPTIARRSYILDIFAIRCVLHIVICMPTRLCIGLGLAYNGWCQHFSKKKYVFGFWYKCRATAASGVRREGASEQSRELQYSERRHLSLTCLLYTSPSPRD